MKIDQKIEEILQEKRVGNFGFGSEHLESFDKRLKELKRKSNRVAISKIFAIKDFESDKISYAQARDRSFRERVNLEVGGKIEVEPKERDFKGLYVWFSENNAFYVGIGGNIIKRLHQHIDKPNHFSASMAYKIAKLVYTDIKDEETGKDLKRKDFPKNKIRDVQVWLRKQAVAFIEIEDDDELAAFEIFCANKLEAILNTFETH